MSDKQSPTSRRAVLFGAGAVAAVGLGAFTYRRELFGRDVRIPATSFSFEDSNACLLTAKVEEGPYYVAQALLRSDIRDDRQGQVLRLKLKIVDGANCAPLPGAAIDIWHCDAQGNYSAAPAMNEAQRDADGHLVAANDQRFLRGRQIADADGMAEFVTIYPGWYPGRTPHIHLKAYMNEREAVTAQLFFTDAQSMEVYAAAPYNAKGAPDTTNEDDHVLYGADGAAGGWPKVTRTGDELRGTLTIGITRA